MTTATAVQPTAVPQATERHDLVPDEGGRDAVRLLDHHTWSASRPSPHPAGGGHLVFGDGHGERYLPLDRPVTHLGRGLVSDVRIEHRSVSRRHALIVRRAGQFRLLDDRSLNGTFLNGRAVEREELRDGDVIRLGGVAIRFRVVAPARSSGDRPDRATLRETAAGAAGGGTVTALRPDPAAPGVWRATVSGAGARRLEVTMEPETGVVTLRPAA